MSEEKNAVQKAIEFLITKKHVKMNGLATDMKTNYPTFQKLRDTGSIQAIEKVKLIAEVLELTPNEVCGVEEKTR